MSSIDVLFAGEGLVSILTLFLLNPDQAYYQAEIHNRVGGTLRNVQKSLEKLQRIGLIHRRDQGRMVYYRANRSWPGFEELKRLFIKTVAVGDPIKTALLRVKEKIAISFIYGSVAEGRETADSDIDLFILSNLGLKELASMLQPLQAEIDREINPVVYPVYDFQTMLENKNRFAQELLTCPKIWLIGDEDEFKRLAQ